MQENNQQQFEDKVLVCKDDKHGDGEREFTWTRGEQKFLHQLYEEGKLDGGVSEPKRCPACRRKKKERFARLERERQQ